MLWLEVLLSSWVHYRVSSGKLSLGEGKPDISKY